MSDQPVIEHDVRLHFDKVSLGGEGYDGPLKDISFDLHAGDLVMIRGVRRRFRLPLLDGAQGLLMPLEGTVLYDGKDWQQMSPYRQSLARGETGRIYGRYDAWLSNLDVDENVTLRVRHHAGLPSDMIYDEAQELARRMGLEELPAVRPPLVSREVLQRCQCVRALLGHPRLVLAEYPCQFMSEDIQQNLFDLLAELRAEGTAVIWLTLNEGLWNTMYSKAKCWYIDGENMVKAEALNE